MRGDVAQPTLTVNPYAGSDQAREFENGYEYAQTEDTDDARELLSQGLATGSPANVSKAWWEGFQKACKDSGIVPYTVNKIAAADPARDEADESPYAVPVGLGLAGLTGLAAAHGVDRVGASASKWVHDSNAAREKLPNKGRAGPLTYSQTDAAMDPYLRGGRELTRSKVLGVPVGKIVGTARHLGEAVPGGVVSMLRGDISGVKKLTDMAPTSHHYDLYQSDISNDKLLHHHLVDVAYHANLPQEVRNDPAIFNEHAKQIMRTPQHPRATIEELRANGHSAAAGALEASWLGGEYGGHKIRGAVSHLAGTDRTMGGVHTYGRIAGNLRRYNPLLVGGSLAALGAGVGMGIHRALEDKTAAAADQEDDTPWSSLAAGSGAGAAIAGGLLARNRMDKPGKNVGVTYGTMGPIGRGHAEPGEAIAKILRNAADPQHPTHVPSLRGANVDQLVRDPRGIMHGTPRGTYDALVDTGFGHDATMFRNWKTLAGSHTGAGDNENIETVAPARIRRRIGYQTDVNPQDREGRFHLQSPTHPIANAHDFSYGWLGYGQGAEAIKGIRYGGLGATLHHVGAGLSPAIDPDVLHAISNENRTSDQVLEHIREAGRKGQLRDVQPAQMPEFERTIDALKGKKLVVVSGSGRGDYTGSRAARLHNMIASDPDLAKDHAVIALHGNGYHGTEGAILRNYQATAGASPTPLTGFGFMPKDLFNALQQTSHVHWGSTGTSSASEASAHGNILAVPGHWGQDASDRGKTWRETTAPETPKSIADAHNEMAANAGIRVAHEDHPKLNTWNQGNIQHLLSQPGVLRADGPEHIVGLLKDPKRAAEMSVASGQRARDTRRQLVQGQAQLAHAVGGELARTQRIHNLKGLGYGVLGAGLAGLSAYSTSRAAHQHDGEQGNAV